MTLIPWLDAAMPPTPTQAQEAYRRGYRACGYYLPDVPNTDPYRTWTVGEEQVLPAAGLAPVPICVPNPDLAGAPAATARAALTSARTAGLNPTVAVLYDGPHLVNTGRITGPVWLPIPQTTAPTSVGPRSAIQWSQADINGWTVDLNVAAADFPFGSAVVCDLEHAVLDHRTVDEAVAWYQTFQATVAQAVQPPPSPAPPTPVGDKMLHTVTMKIGADGCGWAECDGNYPTPTGPAPAIPWSTFQACTLQGSYPPVDGYWPGAVKAQDRDNNVCVTVTGYTSNSTATVFVLTSA